MNGQLQILLNSYGISVKNVRQLRGGLKLLELFSIPTTSSPSENFRILKELLRTYFPQLDQTLCTAKCSRGDRLELAYIAVLSVGALIAQDLSKASSCPGQGLPGRLKNLCDYNGPEINSIKEFCEIIFTGDDVASKVRDLVAGWLENSENENSFSSGSSLNTSINSNMSRNPLSPLNAVMCTPENRQRVREKYNQEVVKLRGDLMIMRERYDNLESDMKVQAESNEKQVRELQNRVRILREMIDADSQESPQTERTEKDEVSIARLKILQKQVQQLQDYEQKFFDEKSRSEELETKLLQDEKRIKELKAKIVALETSLAQRDEELIQTADQVSLLKDKIEEERLNQSFIKQRANINDTCESIDVGENLGDAVLDLVSAELRKNNDDLRSELDSKIGALKQRDVELAELQLANQMANEQIVELEKEVTTLRAQIREHLETITHAADEANCISASLTQAQDEVTRLRTELGAACEANTELLDTQKYLEKEVDSLSYQLNDTNMKFAGADKERGIFEEQLKAQTAIVAELRSASSQKSERISALEAELSSSLANFTETVQSMQTQLSTDRTSHGEERIKLDQTIDQLRSQLEESTIQNRTLYSEIEKLKIERAELHTQLNVQLESEVRLKNEVASFRSKYEETLEEKNTFEVSFKQTLELMESYKSQLDKAAGELSEQKDQGSKAQADLAGKAQELVDMTKKFEALDTEYNRVKKNYITTCAHLDEKTEKCLEASSLVGTLESSITDLRSDMEEKIQTIKSLERKMVDLDEALERSSEDQKFMQDALAEASSSLSAGEQVVSKLKGELEIAQEKLSASDAHLTTREITMRVVEAQLEGLTDTIMQKDSTIEQKNALAASLDAKLQEANEKLQEVTTEYFEMRDSFGKQTEELDAIRQRFKDIELARCVLSAENVKLVEQMTELREQFSESMSDVSRKESEIAEMTTAIGVLGRTIEELEKKSLDAEALTAEKEEIAIELTKLRTALAEETRTVEEINEKIADLDCAQKQLQEELASKTAELIASRDLQLKLEDLAQENEQLKKDLDLNLDQIKEFVDDIDRAMREKEVLQSERDELKRTIESLQSRSTSVEGAERWKNFKREMVDILESIDVQAPVMEDPQILEILKKAVSDAKQKKELEVEKRNLQRLAENAEAKVKCQIVELTSENDKLKRKLRECSKNLETRDEELREIVSTVVRVKAGDTVDGDIVSPTARDIINLAVASEENRASKKELTDLRLSLSEAKKQRDEITGEMERTFQAQISDLRARNETLQTYLDRTMDTQKSFHERDRENSHAFELMQESHNLEIEKLERELRSTRDESEKIKTELLKSKDYISTLLQKYDSAKQHNERRISGLHGILNQNNISLPKPRRKSPNQPGVPMVAGRSSEDDVMRKMKEKDEEIRRLRMAKRELEKRICFSTMNESRFSNIGGRHDFSHRESMCMPPPSFSSIHGAMSDRVWNDYRDPHFSDCSASHHSSSDFSTTKSMPAFQTHSYERESASAKSLLYDNDVPSYHRGSLQMSVSAPKMLVSKARNAQAFMPESEDSPNRMFDKPLPSHADARLSSAFDNISNLNQKCDLDASCLSTRVGLTDLGFGDDEEAQIMIRKNLDDLKAKARDDPNRGSELVLRNSLVLPHLRSSYPVETQNGKIPVTPLVKRQTFNF